MTDTSISAETLLNYFPDSLLDKLSIEHKVDYQVKKLDGKLVFKWLLYGVLSTNELSLNVLMNIFETVEFKSYSGINSNLTTKRTHWLTDFQVLIVISFKVFSSIAKLWRINTKF
jgi:hypothetical protein